MEAIVSQMVNAVKFHVQQEVKCRSRSWRFVTRHPDAFGPMEASGESFATTSTVKLYTSHSHYGRHNNLTILDDGRTVNPEF